jgi:hypothetical protein
MVWCPWSGGGSEEAALEAASNAVEFAGNGIGETAHGNNGAKGNQGSNQCILNEVLAGFVIEKGPEQIQIHYLSPGVASTIHFVYGPIVERSTTVGTLKRGCTRCGNNPPVQLRQSRSQFLQWAGIWEAGI